jgi:hypothetical protein
MGTATGAALASQWASDDGDHPLGGTPETIMAEAASQLGASRAAGKRTKFGRAFLERSQCGRDGRS